MSNNNDITLSVGMETSEVTRTADALGKKLEAIFDRASGKKLSASTKSLLQHMDALSIKMDKIRQSMADMEGKTFKNSQYAELNKELEEAQERAQQLKLDLEVATPDKRGAITNQLKEANAEAQRLQTLLASTPETLAGEETQKYQNLAYQLNNVINSLTVYKAKLAETQDGAGLENSVSQWQRLANTIGRVAVSLARLALTPIVRGLRAVASAALAAAKNLAKMAATKIGQGISKLGSSIFGLKKDISSADDSFKRGLRTFVKYAFGVRSLFFLIRRLRTFLLQGLQGLGDAYAPFGETIQSFKNSLNELKGSFVSAFAPIASTVIPILNTLMRSLAKVLDLIGMLFAALRGQTSYVKAQVVPATDAAAGSAGSAADAAEKYKKTIAGFDDVEILHNPNSSAGGAGAGGGGSSDVSWTATEMPIDSVIAELAQNIRELIANQNWEGLGTFLAEKVNSIFTKAKNLLESSELQDKISSIINAITTTLNTFVDKIDWNLIGETFGDGINLIVSSINQLLTGINWTEIGSNIATGFNGLIKKVDWDGIGKLFSNRLNIIIDSINGFVSNFKWKSAASKFTQGLNSFINNIHWSDAAHAISEGIKGALNFLTTSISEFDWRGLGNKVAQFLRDIDWSGILSALSEAFGAVIGGLGELLIGLIEDAWQGVVDWWHDVAFEDGQFTISGLLEGILDALKNIGTWIKEHIFEPFINGFKKAFKIDSPSKVMATYGGYIIEGLLNGILSTWESIIKFFKSAIKKLGDFFSDPIGTIKVAIDKSVTTAKNVWNSFKSSTVVKTLKETGSSVISKALNTWNNLKNSTAVKTLREVGGTTISRVKSVWDGLKNSSVTKTLRETGSVTINTVKNKIWDKITSGVAIKTLRSVMDRTFTNAKDTYDSMTNKTVNVTARATRFYNSLGYTPEISVRARITSVTGALGSSIYGRAAGGILFNGLWRNIPQYAKGTLGARGSMFVAGEAGPEIVGHINGRTEVLNQSQLAEAMYASVSAAFATVLKTALQYLGSVLFTCANSVITAINTFETALPNMLPSTISIPEIATGYVVPSTAQIAAVQRSNELLTGVVDSLNQSSSDRLTNDELERIIERVIRRTLNIQFYIGDEQLARHANAGNDKLALRYNSAT